MLNTNDKKEIKGMVVDSLAEFFHTLIAPVLEQIQEQNRHEHRKTRESIQKLGQDVYKMKDYINDHEKRVKKLEKASFTS